MADFKVYVTDGRHSSYDIERDMLAQIGAELQVCQCATEEDIIRECSDADAILLDMAPMSAKAINALAHCKIINRYGVGYDNVDLNACTAKGIQVTNVPVEPNDLDELHPEGKPASKQARDQTHLLHSSQEHW